MDMGMPVTASVLVVEDDASVRASVEKILRLNGYGCIMAENGQEGLELFRRHSPDVVLTDIMMPVMNGLEMARAIRAEAPESPFVFMTALGESRYILEAVEIGANRYVVKPLEIPKLLKAISQTFATLRLEAEARRARHLKAINTLAGGLAHDFNNLLHAIMGYVYLAKVHSAPDGLAYAHLNEAESGLCSAGELGQRLLTLSGVKSASQKLSLEPVIMESVKAALARDDIAAIFYIEPDLPWIMCNPDQMQQVFTHLTINAAEAMPRGGELVVSAGIRALSRESGLPLATGEYVQINFRDNGTGIHPEHLPKIFDPYFTTKSLGSCKGQGLGLTVCHAIISSLGGLISAGNLTPSGTVFSIWLPCTSQ